jgi:tripartite ATP-independent transporter DctP family solute receptor
MINMAFKKTIKYWGMLGLAVAAALIIGMQPAIAADKVLKMTLAHADVADPTMYVHAGAVAFKAYVEKESNGKIQVNISPAAALGNTASLQEMTMTGEIEASTSHTEGTIAIVYPNIQCLSIPYLFQNVDQALEVFRGDFGKRLWEDMRKQTGLRVIGIWDNGGFRNFTNNKREVHNPNDMKGLSIRTMDNPSHMEIVRSLGAKPTPISWAETYTALQTGVVDGEENSIPTFLLGSLQEVQKYMTMDGHVYSQLHMFVNDKWFNGLPKEYQEIILRGGEEAGYAGERANRVYRDIGRGICVKAGVKFYDPTVDEINQFKALAQPPVLKFIREKGVKDPKWVDEIIAEADKALYTLGYKKKGGTTVKKK